VKRKAILYNADSEDFTLECGHKSPLMVMPDVNIKKTMERFNHNSLYRDCRRCEILVKKPGYRPFPIQEL